MRVKVRVLGTRYLKADGTLSAPLETPEELAEQSAQAEARHDERQVSAALEHYRQNRDLEPLLALLLEANPGILRNPDALSLLSSAARGEAGKGRGRVRTMDAIERDRRIVAAARWLQELGMPLKNAPDRNRDGEPQAVSACRLIAERVNLSEDAAYSIVRRHGRTARRLRGFLAPWELVGEQPTPEWVLRHYLPTEEERGRVKLGALYIELARPSIAAAARRVLEKRSRARPAKLAAERGPGEG